MAAPRSADVQPMWRQFQLLPFTGMALGISVTLTLTMVVFTYLLFLNLFAQSFSRSLVIVLGVLVVVSLTTVLLTVTQLTYVTVTARQDRDVDAQRAAWQTRFDRFLAGGEVPQHLSALAQDELLQRREAQADHPDSARLAALYAGLGLRERDEALALRHRNGTTRALALERLVLLRDDRTLPVFLTLLRDARGSLRNLALLGAARALSVPGAPIPPDLTGVLTSGAFSTQQVREALCLIGPPAEPLVRHMAADARDRWRELAVDAATRLDPQRYADLADTLLRDPTPGVRAGALRLYAGGAPLHPGMHALVLAQAQDPAWAVRAMSAQAMRAFAQPPTVVLWRLLGDPNWWVRQHAAQTLARSEAGRAVLGRAVTEHPDRFARDMARTVTAELTVAANLTVPAGPSAPGVPLPVEPAGAAARA
ncbi:hypothetical protein GCM10008959_40730 [Deinococcus seoulensis]|uniref:HEAT repeat domain-containing protein n=1 Tax=Deinococcus seoulensis TaxID=1837379 RepID=A0ABQ2S1A6_9DEIO|nr:hypothetical protein [Deinococcus seoulensis]GGR75514.1 hypothetical protein GCM10008959_40730 [Deinococcus seoulensis]